MISALFRCIVLCQCWFHMTYSNRNSNKLTDTMTEKSQEVDGASLYVLKLNLLIFVVIVPSFYDIV